MKLSMKRFSNNTIIISILLFLIVFFLLLAEIGYYRSTRVNNLDTNYTEN